MAAITLHGVGKSFGGTRAVEGIDLEIGDKEFAVFVGPSGCGKSTLLRLIAGLEDLSCGEIRFDGQPVHELPPAERGIAMVFQSYALYPHMSVFDNMAFGLKLERRGRAAVSERVHEAARILQITELLDRKPRQLSGGQRQRVAIGRAIVRNPRVFLFDEPLSNLDAALRVQMRVEIARLHRSLDATMVYVTHDQVEAMTLADRIVVLNEGRVEQVGPPLALYHHPRNLFVAGFIGSPRMNFLDGVVADSRDGTLVIDLGEGMAARVQSRADRMGAGQKVILGLRPEHLVAGDGGDVRLAGEVIAIEHLGGETYIHIAGAGGEALLLKGGSSVNARVGERLAVGAPASACHVFDQAGNALMP